MSYRRVASGVLKGRNTYLRLCKPKNGYEDANPHKVQGNSWSSCENNSTTAWNINFSVGSVNNNNKYNSFVVRPVVAVEVPQLLLELVKSAYIDCCRNKKGSKDYLDYMPNATTDLPILAEELWNGTYHPGSSICFLVRYPKWREVFAASFRDRVVHHFLFLHLNPLVEKKLREQGNVSYNCRVGFGTIAAQKAVFDAIYEVTDKYREEAYIFRGDIVGFFMSIDKNLLWELLCDFLQKEYNSVYKDIILETTRKIIFHNPEDDCIFNTDIREWKNIPPNKSLFTNGKGYGMPIGNLTTQLFANFLMSFFDEFILYLLKLSGGGKYARFVDDFIIIAKSKQDLSYIVSQADVFLKDQLHLRLHHEKHYFQRASHGVKFVGAVIKNSRIYLSNRTIARFTERVHGFSELLTSGKNVYTSDLCRIQSVVNSYLGFCKGKRTYNIRKRVLLSFNPIFYHYFYIVGHYETIKLRGKFKPLNLEL